MARDVRLWLEDIAQNGDSVAKFLDGRSLEDYLGDEMLRAAVERKLFNVGEAVTQIKNQYANDFEGFTDAADIIGFRNLLAHGYFALDDRRVLHIATVSLSKLVAQVQPKLDAIE